MRSGNVGNTRGPLSPPLSSKSAPETVRSGMERPTTFAAVGALQGLWERPCRVRRLPRSVGVLPLHEAGVLLDGKQDGCHAGPVHDHDLVHVPAAEAAKDAPAPNLRAAKESSQGLAAGSSCSSVRETMNAMNAAMLIIKIPSARRKNSIGYHSTSIGRSSIRRKRRLSSWPVHRP